MRVTISISKDLNDRWAKVAKKFKMSKSGMIQDLLEDIITCLEQEQAQDIIKKAFCQLGNEVGGLFEVKNEKE